MILITFNIYGYIYMINMASDLWHNNYLLELFRITYLPVSNIIHFEGDSEYCKHYEAVI